MSNLQFSTNRVLVVTSCTSRKKAIGAPVTLPALDSTMSLDRLAQAWVERARQGQPRRVATALYMGRSFQDALASAARTEGVLSVVSAGFGLVGAGEELPNYNLTVSHGAGSISAWLKHNGATASDWWEVLNKAWGTPYPLTKSLTSPTAEVALLALPASYLQMVAADLKAVPSQLTAKIRIFTSRPGAKLVPEQLQSSVLPYDERLEQVSQFSGTKSDFPQRAMRHFIEAANGSHLSLDEAKARVEELLCSKSMERRAAGQRATDERIMDVLQSQWETHGGSSTRLLRFLRDVERIACEQKRFQKLWKSLKETRQV